MRMLTGKYGHVKEIRDENGDLLREVTVNGMRFRRNAVYSTYNSIVNNQILYQTEEELTKINK